MKCIQREAGRLINHIVLDGVTHKLCISLHAHLLEDSRAIRAYCLVAQKEVACFAETGWAGLLALAYS